MRVHMNGRTATVIELFVGLVMAFLGAFLAGYYTCLSGGGQ